MFIPLVLFLAGVGVRASNGNTLVINEIYPSADTKQEWLELYNGGAKPVDLRGYTIGSSRGVQGRLQGTIEPGKRLVVRAEVGGWNAAADVAVLRNPTGKVIDSVNWGKPTLPKDVTLLTGAVPVPRPGQALTRNPQGLDSNTAADWQPTKPSQGTQSPASLNPGLHRLLFAATNYMSVIAGFLLWGAFLMIGLIAQRFELLTGQKVYWLAMVLVPVGIVVYNGIQAYAFFTAGRMSDCSTGWGFTVCQQGWAFTPILISAIAMAYIVFRFYGIARDILDLKEA